MPDVVVFVRPDVTLDGAVPATLSHPRVHDFDNAVRVQQSATDLGVVEIRVGQGLNANVVLGTETTVAGAGHDVSIVAGNAVGGGPSAGGDISVQPGTGIGGGVSGALTLYSSDAFALWISSDLATGVLFGPTTYSFTDFGILAFGTSTDVTLRYSTAQTNDALIVGTGVNSAAQSGNIILTAAANVGVDHAYGVSPNPRLFIASTTAPGTNFVALHHDATNAVLRSGTNTLQVFDGGAAFSLLPQTTNQLTVGSASLALAAVVTRIVRPDTGQNLLIQEAAGNTRLTFVSAGAIQMNSGGFQPLDNINIQWGNGSDVQARWSTANANNAMVFATGVNAAAQSGNILITTAANVANEHGLAAVATPRLAIFSAADMSVAGNRTQYIQLYHDGTNAKYARGTGVHSFDAQLDVTTATGYSMATGGFVGNGGGQNRIFFSSTTTLNFTLNSVAGTISFNAATTASSALATFVQPVNTSGTPTGLLWTAGAHTGLLNASLNDWNIDLSRLVTFTGGGATSFAFYRGVAIDAPTLGAVTAGLTVTDSATVYIAGAPVAEDGDITLTRVHSLLVNAGQVTVVATLVVGANVAITAGHAAQVVGKLRMTDVINFDFAAIDGAGAPPVFDDVPAAYSPNQVGWLEIEVEGASGLVPFFPVV